VGRTLEGTFERYLEQAQQQAAQPQEPSPEQQKAQADMQIKQAELQITQQKVATESQIEQAKLQFEQQMEAQKIQFEQWRTQLEIDTKMAIAQLQAQTEIKRKSMEINADRPMEGILFDLNEFGEEQPASGLSRVLDAMNSNMAQLMEAQNVKNQLIIDQQMKVFEQVANQQAAIEQLNRPKTVVRDNNGRIIGVK
jgi:hypothetical protein